MTEFARGSITLERESLGLLPLQFSRLPGTTSKKVPNESKSICLQDEGELCTTLRP